MPPETETLVTVKVRPQSLCRLYHADTDDRGLRLDADDRGIVRFHANPRRGADVVELLLDCRDEHGMSTLHTVAVASDFRHSVNMSSPELVSHATLEGTVRPPLDGDPMAPSIRELVARGYPPRPDPAHAAARYERWLVDVSRAATIIARRKVPRPEYSRSQTPHASTQRGSAFNADFSTWCGAYCTKPRGQFSSAFAQWGVPAVIAAGAPAFSAMGEWVGLDSSPTDLYQSGTAAECWNLSNGILNWQFTTYFMWTQSLPWYFWTLPNFPVSPGDTVSVDIWVADQFGTTEYRDPADQNDGLTRADNLVWLYLTSSTGAAFIGTYPAGPTSLGGEESTGFSGGAAEFIVENPDLGGNALARFLPTLMTDCGYADALTGDQYVLGLGPDDGTKPFDGDLTYLDMVNPANGHLLATPAVIPQAFTTDHSMLFIWLDWQ